MLAPRLGEREWASPSASSPGLGFSGLTLGDVISSILRPSHLSERVVLDLLNWIGGFSGCAGVELVRHGAQPIRETRSKSRPRDPLQIGKKSVVNDEQLVEGGLQFRMTDFERLMVALQLSWSAFNASCSAKSHRDAARIPCIAQRGFGFSGAGTEAGGSRSSKVPLTS